jgi:hypothetical protein
LSLTGGLMGIINPIVGLLIGWLQRHLYLSTLITKIFHQEEEKGVSHMTSKKTQKYTCSDLNENSRTEIS